MAMMFLCELIYFGVTNNIIMRFGFKGEIGPYFRFLIVLIGSFR